MDTAIAGGEVFVTCPNRNYVIVRLETANGIIGWGDATLNGREKAVEAALEHHILPELDGHDARRIEDIWQMLFRQTYWRGGPVLNTALAGVDMALWDIKGKIASLPVYELLGGRTRDYAPVYDHCGADSVDVIVANCERALNLGIEHLRVNPHDAPEQYLDVDNTIAKVKAIRERVGPEPELLIDAHGRLDPIESARLAVELEPTNLFFLEDPVRPENPSAFEIVRKKTTTPLAMGELYANSWEMLPLVEQQLVDFIRTDLVHIGGITAGQKLATIGEHHYVRTAFHGPPDISPIGFAATVQIDLSIPNFGIQELPEYMRPYEAYDRLDDVFESGVRFRKNDGGVDIVEAPGLGVEVDEDAAEMYPFKRGSVPKPRHPDGSVQDW